MLSRNPLKCLLQRFDLHMKYSLIVRISRKDIINYPIYASPVPGPLIVSFSSSTNYMILQKTASPLLPKALLNLLLLGPHASELPLCLPLHANTHSVLLFLLLVDLGERTAGCTCVEHSELFNRKFK